MKTFQETAICTIAAVVTVIATLTAQPTTPWPAKKGFEKLKALEGEWIDVDGVFGPKGVVAVTYHVTSAGNAVVETFPVNTPGEMVTVYHLDGQDLLLTHFCSSGNQPRMRSKGLDGNTLTFDFAGGTNIDPATTSHMHAAKIEFVSEDEIRGTWQNWRNGQPHGHDATFRVVRRKSTSQR
jgi:hypothetical protein